MYLAPFNYDRFFKKVFSHIHIAKSFLEDFLEVEISSIQPLDLQHFLTDHSSKIEFDYRCTIGDTEVIIDMQQWYKTDVIKRFYTYHSAGTVLQLEQIKTKQTPIATDEQEETKTKDYSELKPVITLIWMVDDTLQYKDNFVAFTMSPEHITSFIRNKEIWDNPQIITLLNERKKVLEVLDNDTKELDFLPKNRLIFMFQTNISKDAQIKKYCRWFNFAQKTKSKTNKESDFKEYAKDPIFKEIMRLIATRKLSKDELAYIETEEEKQIEIERFLQGEYNMGVKEGFRTAKKIVIEKEKIIKEREKTIKEKEKTIKEKEIALTNEKKRAEESNQRAEEEKKRAEESNQRAEEEKKRAEERLINIVLKLNKKGFASDEIANDTGLEISEINRIIDTYPLF